MRYVPIKSLGQQTVLTLHLLCTGLVKDRTSLINQFAACSNNSKCPQYHQVRLHSLL